ncbi:TlpA family protein disulfide reductase [Sphingobacterium spiritivorum]|uniref:Antioxidant, AhpC/TSA family n=1 Tax=Sphingobacterium spiritivorum ATCC 33861 TaxID=525373 RepID=D7VMF3_SPHSI|nr:TlpA disulfide reductase family protein [Sphingobacterium spiritivorum]EFK58158.1 antioxidant, AhpC/TSA family [Sphingobacterium spiritivorum ATCC 33861]QQT37988.1 TlpA family protein disulfide reductase [Sphingobacterium spiritivorum]WQD36255.1 TlpA disulfide reductase family protein [Sphingobacterium spiritivorum]SUJ00470.1 Thiol-disulfide oxidoreductase resA [Sphingobacterium spiritivorum]
MNPKTKKIVINVVFVVLIALLVWPTSRAYFQQGLMKIGLFKPKLEVPKTPDSIPEGANAVQSGEPNLAFVDASGKTIQTHDLKGKVVFVNFWATWCPPCKAEMPSIQKLYDKFKNNDKVAFLIVEIENDTEKALQFMQDEKLTMPVHFPAEEIPQTWLGGSIPTTLILDKAGAIVTRHEGMADYSRKEVVDFIEELINK